MRKPEISVVRISPNLIRAISFVFVFVAQSVFSQPWGGIIASNGVRFGGSAMTLDSFDSSSSNHSIWQTNFLYHGQGYGVWSNTLSFDTNSVPSRTANAILATDSSLLDVGYAHIAGYVDTAPGGAVSIGSNGSVGDLNWVFVANNYGIQTGYQRDDMNMVFSSYSLPIPISLAQTNWLAVPVPRGGSTNIDGVTYTLTITNRPANSNLVYYSYGPLLSDNLFIDASNVVLCLSNGVYNSTITVNTNADVKIWSMGDIMESTAVINNKTGNAHAVSLNDMSGLPISMSFSRSGFGVGSIYAPSSALTFNGGPTRYDVVGAIICDTLTVSGRYNFHIDESFGIPGTSPWITVQPTNEIVQVGSQAMFMVTAGGSGVGYQWYHYPSNSIPGGTNSSLLLTNVQFLNSGVYMVVVSNSYGSVTSAPASLVVFTNATPTLASSFDAVNNWFRFNVAGVTGLKYAIQSSTNLSDWVLMATNVSPFAVTDFNAGTFPQRFYRSVYIP